MFCAAGWPVRLYVPDGTYLSYRNGRARAINLVGRIVESAPRRRVSFLAFKEVQTVSFAILLISLLGRLYQRPARGACAVNSRPLLMLPAQVIKLPP